MKKLLLSICLFACGAPVFSQINKGQWLLGGGGSFSNENRGKGYYITKTIEANVQAGYFWTDRLAGGVRVSSAYSKRKYVAGGDPNYILRDVALAASPFVRYYLLPASQKVNFLADGSYNREWNWYHTPGYPTSHSHFNGFTLAAGPALFLSPQVALEFTLGYGWKKQPESTTSISTFKSAIGFMVHLGKGSKTPAKD